MSPTASIGSSFVEAFGRDVPQDVPVVRDVSVHPRPRVVLRATGAIGGYMQAGRLVRSSTEVESGSLQNPIENVSHVRWSKDSDEAVARGGVRIALGVETELRLARSIAAVAGLTFTMLPGSVGEQGASVTTASAFGSVVRGSPPRCGWTTPTPSSS